jgi:hypothetical protein
MGPIVVKAVAEIGAWFIPQKPDPLYPILVNFKLWELKYSFYGYFVAFYL